MKGILSLHGDRNITLQQRLATLKGHLVEINAPNTGLEPGRLEFVYKANFIRVQGELFVPASLNSIRVFDIKPPRRSALVGVRTTFPSGSAFNRIRLVRIGSDFIELQGKGKNPSRILFPLNKVEGIYRAL
ncbi:hypothetical protein SAMN05661091_4701 [Paenibacillus uliginis N3/975]|uniref:Uncharacterized protein n=1 Tax=Paenibacillus uliginis N3/975 TaxID=1313296 RepID=A0A1X7HPG9_9BACL|nr:hypothetical protein [Paenibacillus uliginis]SMF89580.1 hypothetical protein SAMN05661091_4701 [Paenibacillus uliginis N3/975]